MKEKVLFLYYILLLVILCSWTDTVSSPSMSARIVYLIAVVLPAAINKNWIPVIFTCFMVIATEGFAHSYFPSGLNYFGDCALLTIIFSYLYDKNSNFRNTPSVVYFLLIYVAIVDLITSGSLQPFSYLALLTVTLLLNVDMDSQVVRLGWSTAFAVATIILSIAFLFNQVQFVYEYDDGLDRIGWKDPNYFGMALGMGTMVSINEFLSKRSGVNLLFKIIFIVAVVVSFPVLFLNGSRGAILSISVGTVISLFSTHIKTAYKILVIGVFVAFISYLYTNDYMEFFLYRVKNLQGGDLVNGRTDIWQIKIDAFFNDGGFLNILCGFGYQGGRSLGATNEQIAFHNDFIAFMVEYGFVGLVLFISMLIAPFKSFWSLNKRNIAFLSSFFFMIFCLISLEPFTLGSVSFFFFYAYLVFLSKQRAEIV